MLHFRYRLITVRQLGHKAAKVTLLATADIGQGSMAQALNPLPDQVLPSRKVLLPAASPRRISTTAASDVPDRSDNGRATPVRRGKYPDRPGPAEL